MADFYGKYSGQSGASGTGVLSLDGMTGIITLIAGTGITITDGSGTITIAATSSFSPGNLTDVGTDGITITGGTNAVNGSGTSISQHVADSTHNGYLSSTDWTTFNNKQATITIGALDAQTGNATGLALVSNVLSTQSATATVPGMVNTGTQTFAGAKTFNSTIVGSVSGTAANVTGIVALINGGTGVAAASANSAFNALSPMNTGGDLIYGGASGVGLRLANGSAGQVLTSAGTTLAPTWSTPSGGTVTSVSVVTANGVSGSVATATTTPAITLTLGAITPTTVNGNTLTAGSGTLTLSTFTLTVAGTASITGTNTGDVTIGTANGLSLVGQALSLGLSSTSTTGALSSTDWNTFNGKQAAGNYITALTGDVTASGPGSVAATLATVNGNVGSFGSSTSIPTFTVNAKGLITAASGNVVIAPAGTLSGTTLNATVVSSSLTSVGTITTGVWTGTTIAIANGGTGATTKAGAFDALSPMTTGGDLIYGGASGTGTRLANGSSGQILTSAGGTSAPTWSAPAAAAAGTLTGTTLAANVVSSSLTSVGTITTGVWTGTTIAIANGGTGQTTKAAAFDALSPMTTGGDLIYGGASGTGTRLANGSSGQFLKSNGTTTAPSWATPVAAPAYNYTAQTGTYAAVIGDTIKVTSGTFTITLPTAASVAGQSIQIGNYGTGVVTIATTSSQTIAVAGTALASAVIKMGSNGDRITVTSDGANWICTVFDIFVGARANTSTTTVSSSPATIIFTSVQWNPQTDYATGTGLYTVTIPGTYDVQGRIYADATNALDDLVQTVASLNAANTIEQVDRTTAGLSNIGFCVGGRIRAVAGDTISIRFNMGGTSPSITSSRNSIDIVRVGN